MQPAAEMSVFDSTALSTDDHVCSDDASISTQVDAGSIDDRVCWDDASIRTRVEVLSGAALPLSIQSVPYAALLTAVNQKLVRKSDDITGLRLWEFSTCLARFVAEHREQFEGATVLELGCGCGHLALSVAVSARDSTVIATDYSERTLRCARDNFDTHRARVVARAVRIEQLTWSKIAPAGVSLGPVDFVFACDCLYYISSAAAVLATAARLLAVDGVFIFGGRARSRTTIASIRAAAVHALLELRFVDMDFLRTSAAHAYWDRTDADGSNFALLALSAEPIERFMHGIGGALRVDDAVNDDSDGILDGVW